jgi:membrane-bound lytic murein transglycosylase D
MKAKVRNNVLILLIAGLLGAWGCSSGPKPAAKPKPPDASAQAAPAAGPAAGQESRPPAANQKQPTTIPAEELELPPAVLDNGDQEKTGSGGDDASTLEEAMNACQEAEQLWERGDFDAALATLDSAYGLLLKCDLPPDSPLCQEKNDLRLTIAKRIQTIHASRINPPKENHKTIPLVENKYVLQEIQSFQTKERKSFEEAYERSGLYRELIAREFRQAGIPEELSWLPMIESWFKVRALSRARALGLWQFIASTGALYDLKRDRYIDERMDPLKATRAAARYLSDLHGLFGDWTTALAAYNCGEFRVQRVISSQQVDYLDNFWDLFAQLPYETARFVPRFIAAQMIINDPGKYGFDLPTPYPPLSFETVTVNHPTKLSTLSANLGLDKSELAFLNPELRFDATPDSSYELKVPVALGDKVGQAIASLPRWVPPEATYFLHYVRRGENLGLIARRYHTSVSAIVRLNGLRSSRLIRPGWRLKIPGRGAASASGSQSVRSASRPAPAARADGETYVVTEGDTPYSIARRFGLSLEDFLAANGLTMRSIIKPGQVVSIKKK